MIVKNLRYILKYWDPVALQNNPVPEIVHIFKLIVFHPHQQYDCYKSKTNYANKANLTIVITNFIDYLLENIMIFRICIETKNINRIHLINIF